MEQLQSVSGGQHKEACNTVKCNTTISQIFHNYQFMGQIADSLIPIAYQRNMLQ